MVSAVARTGTLLMEAIDVDRAKAWLLLAEKVMPDIFRDMTLRSDSQVIEELHWFLWQIWLKEKKPIHESRAIHFLQTRLPAEKIMRVMDVAVASGIIARTDNAAGRAYTPRPSHEHGVVT
jgi:hypothetical protein